MPGARARKTLTRYSLKFGFPINPLEGLPYITDIKDRFKHNYIIGKTGQGKSVLLERMAVNDAKFGAVVFIDPKGDSAKRLYHLLDKDRIIYLSIKHPLTINPLRKKGYKLNALINEFIQCLDILIQLTSPNVPFTVGMREIITNAILAIREPDRDLDFLASFLSFAAIRLKYRPFIPDDLQEYWKDFDAIKGNLFLNKEKIDSAKRISARLATFIQDEEMREIVVGDNELDIEDIIENRKILLVDCFGLTPDKVIYISNLVIYAIMSYCYSGQKKQNPLFVYCDEFQNVVSPLFSNLLAVARSSNIGFTLCHHDFGELTPKVLSSVFGNVDTFITFRVGEAEASKMKEVYGIDKRDFINMKSYHAYIRMGVDNHLVLTYPPLMEEIPEINLVRERRTKERIDLETGEIKSSYWQDDQWINL